MKMLVMVGAVAVSSLLLVPTLAQARPHVEFEQVTQVVRYDPAELATANGAARLQKRVDSVTRRICRNESALPFRQDAQRCMADARQRAQSKVELAIAEATGRAVVRDS